MTRQIVKKSFSFCPRLRRCDRQPYKGQVAWKMDEWMAYSLFMKS